MRKMMLLLIVMGAYLSLPVMAADPPVMMGSWESGTIGGVVAVDAQTSEGWKLKVGSGEYTTKGATDGTKALKVTDPTGANAERVLARGLWRIWDQLPTATYISMDITLDNPGGNTTIPDQWFEVDVCFNGTMTGWADVALTKIAMTVPWNAQTTTLKFVIPQSILDGRASAANSNGDLYIRKYHGAGGATFWIDKIQINFDDPGVVPPPHAAAVDPFYQDTDIAVNTPLTWVAQADIPDDPNMVIVGYNVFLDTVESNVATAVAGGPYDVTAQDADGDTTNTSWSHTTPLAYETEYFWRVDTIVQYDYLTEPNVISNADYVFNFTTTTDNPVVDAGKNVIITTAHLPAGLSGTITDVNSDLTSAQWTLLTDDNDYPGQAARKQAMQMSVRSQIYPSEPNLLKDWIGTDTREKTNGVEKADPLKLTISGLPAGSYAWTSYHHDPENQTGQFDVTISDSDGPQTISNVDISAGIVDPVTTVTATIVADGTNPVVLSFDQLPWNDVVANAMFVMNGFTLVKDADSLKVDFGLSTSAVASGYVAYTAENEVANTFTAQSYSAFGTTVTVNPDWGTAVAVAASVTPDTPFNVYAPTAKFTTDTTGTYKVRLTGTDATAQTGSDLVEIRVYADACAAAKANPNGYTKPQFDLDNNCREDLADFAMFAGKWLEDNSLPDQAAFTSVVNYTPVTPQP